MNILDIILLVCIAAMILFSAIKGFLQSAVELAGYLLTLPVAIWGANAGASWAYETFVHERAVAAVSDKLSAAVSPAQLVENLRSLIDGLPISLSSLFEKLNIDLNQILNGIASTSPTTVAEQFVNEAVRPLATVLCTVVLFAILFLVLLVVVKIVAVIIGHLPKPKLFKKADHALGGVLGAAKALLLVFVICAALAVSVDTAGKYLNEGYTNAVSGSKIVEKVNSFNPVLDKLIK